MTPRQLEKLHECVESNEMKTPLNAKKVAKIVSAKLKDGDYRVRVAVTMEHLEFISDDKWPKSFKTPQSTIERLFKAVDLAYPEK